MKKAAVIIVASVFGTVLLVAITLAIFNPGNIFGTGSLIGSLFQKSYNDDQPFSKNGLFVYENDGSDRIDIQKMSLSIQEYRDSQEYDVAFTTSKKNKYGINIETIIDDNLIQNYSVTYLKREKALRAPHHYTYLYYFEFKTLEAKYVFDLESQGENYLSFSFDEPINTFCVLANQLNIEE